MPHQVFSAAAAPEAASNAPVLLVEDDIDIRNAVRDLLEIEGLSVVVARDGREALDLLRRGLKPSVIVLDLTMPRMNGWEFRQAQMADGDLKDIPVIVATASGFSAEKIRSQFGEVHFLRKPFDSGNLLDVIVHCCQFGRRPTTR